MTETNHKQLRQYLEAGVDLIPLHRFDRVNDKGQQLGKSPVDRGWPTQEYSNAQQIKWMRDGKNVGVRLGGGWAVLDIDPRNGGLEGQKILEQKYGLNFEKHAKVITGRGDGGVHVYVRIPKGFRGVKGLKEIPGVDFIHHSGMFVVAAGSLHPDTEQTYKWDTAVPLTATADCPQLLLEAYSVRRPPKELRGEGNESFGCIDPSEIARALAHLDATKFRDHDDWLTLMMSCHWLSGGEAREEFVEWSTTDQEYADQGAIIGQRWDSLSSDGGFSSRVVKGAFLFKTMNKHGVGEYGPRVSLSSDFGDLEDDDVVSDQAETMTEELKVLRFMNERHAVVNLEGKAFVTSMTPDENFDGRPIDRLVLSQTRDMREMYRGQHLYHQIQGPKGVQTVKSTYYDYWSEHPNRRQYDSVVFDPSQPSEFEDRLGGKVMNLWTGFAFPTDSRGNGSWEMLDRVIREAICDNDADAYNYVLNWIAFSYQNPARAQRVALVLKGGRGVGKGTLARAFLSAWGQHGIATDDGDDLFGKYNADIGHKCGIFLDEAFWSGDRSMRGKLQARITEPKIRIEQKHQPMRHVRNFTKILMASNEDFVVPAGEDERRFVVLECASPFQGDGDFWEALNKQLRNGGNQAFFYDMLHRDLGDFEPEKDRIMTDALREQKLLTLGELGQWWIEVLQSGELPNQIGDWSKGPVYVPIKSLRASFEDFLGTNPKGDWAYSLELKLPKRLCRILPVETLKKSRVKVPDSEDYLGVDTDNRGRAWFYKVPDLSSCKHRIEGLFGSSIFQSDEDELDIATDRIDTLTSQAEDAALEGDFDLCAELLAEVDALYAEYFEGGDLI